MPTYIYKVRDKSGKTIDGRMRAADGKDLRTRLSDKEYFLIEYFEEKPKEGFMSSVPFLGLGKVKLTDMSIFSWQLYTMLDAGLPLVNSLKVIMSQTKNKRLRTAIDEVRRRIEEGASFSESLSEHPKVFPRLYVHMVNAGEVGGVLDEMLKRLAIYFENQAEITSRIRSALTYPILLLVVSVCVAAFLVSYVLPKFVIVFEDMGASIPVPTRLLLEVSKFIRYYWFAIVTAVIGLFVAYKGYSSTKDGRLRVDQLKLNIPFVGDLIRKTVISRFAQTLSILVSGGISILTSLDVVTDAVGNTAVSKVLRDVSASVSEGKTISEPLEESRVFPDTVVNMVRVGEETGALDKMLGKISDFYNREVDNAIKTFTKLIEPLLIVAMAVVIGFIAMSVFLPMTDIMEQIHR